MIHQRKKNLVIKGTTYLSDRLPLSSLRPGQSGIVVEISGGNNFLSRMLSLGFSIGVEVKILQNYSHGPILACVRDSRVALGRGESEKIILHRTEA